MRIIPMKVGIFFVVLLLTSVSSTQVDNLNILLPQLKQAPPTLPLQLITAQAGCYDWNSSFPEHLQVSPHLPNNIGCSRQAVISVAKLGHFGSTIYVSAIDGASQSTLNIPVRIRKISKIAIASKSRMMNIKELQKLQLFGYDADGNTFTSLQGLRFNWQLDQHTQIIQTVLLHNSQLYLPLRTRENLEKKGYQSDMLVVRAIAPGNLKVRVKCIQPGYQNITDEITISVHERFQLKPGPVLHMAADTSFQLKLVRPNSEQIPLPQPYYRIISCNKFVINDTLHLNVPAYPSKCTIRVQDTRTKPAYQSSVQIVVFEANQLRIKTDPLIIVGRNSPYQIQLYHNGDALLGQSRRILYSSDFTLRKDAKTLVAKNKGSGYLTAELGQLKKTVIINAMLPVSILLHEHYIHLPVGEHFKLRVLGGTGLYDFQISNDIASINSVSMLHAKQIGEALIVMRDRNHAVNQITVRLKVSEISTIYSLEENKEANRDQWAFFYVLAKNSAKQTFTQCQSAQFSLSVPTANLDIDPKVNFMQSMSFLQFYRSQLVQAAIAPTSLLKGKQFQIVDSFKAYVNENEISAQDLKSYILSLQSYGICKALKFKSIISFQQRALLALQGQPDIKTTVPLRVYDIIQTTIQGENNLFLMTPDSSLNWTFTGGSYPWPTSATLASINGQLITSGSNPVIRCPNKQTSSQTYGLKIYNQQTKQLLFPVFQTTSISLICKYPKKLFLALQHAQIFDELFIEKETELKGQVRATDDQSQEFYNSSNVVYQFSSLTGVVNYIGKQFHYRSQGKNDTLSILAEKLNNDLTFNRVFIDVSVYLAEPVVISHPLSTDKKQITIVTLFTPKKPYVLHISHMHSQLQIQCSNAISCEKGQNYIAVKLLKLGKGSLHLRDKKIYGSQDWHFQFVIVEPDEVRISGNKDYLQQGDILQVNVTNYFNSSEISPFTYEPSYLGIIVPTNLKILQQNINTFKVKAEKVGIYQIEGESTYPSIKRTKYPLNITVYKKISINIDDLVSKLQENVHIMQANTAIVVGCRRFLRIQGGPKQFISKVAFNQAQISINQIDNRSLELSSKKQGVYTFVIEVYYRKGKIAQIHGSVTVNNIQKVQLQTIDEPVVGAHFRIHPRFKIGDQNLEELYCDYFYSWKTAAGILKLGDSLSFGLLDAAAINATAIKAGNEIVTFEVKEKSGSVVIQQTKHIEVQEDIDLGLPTYINKGKNECVKSNPTSIIMAPNTRKVFSSEVKIKSDEGIVHIGQSNNYLQSSKKLGHSTIKLSQSGYRSVYVQVQVKQISGVFIDNTEGFINIEPNNQQIVQIYLQDNFGRLFYTPLQNLQVQVSSSNSDLVQASLTQSGDSLSLKSFKQGVCIIYVRIPSRSILDSIAVSVGSAISPGKDIKICKNGIIKFSASSSQAHWSSDNPQIVKIQPNSGVASAVGLGKAKINHGQLSSRVSVQNIAKVEQVGQQIYKGSSVQVQYKFYFLVDNKFQQIANIQGEGAINNNLELTCKADYRYLTTKATIIDKEGHQRLVCRVSLQSAQKWPESFALHVKDSAQSFEEKQFIYKFTPLFTLQKKIIHLSPNKYQTQILIKTPQPLAVSLREGKPKWVVDSYYDERKKQQKIVVDMKGHQSEISWYLDISLQGQQEQIKISFRTQSQREEAEHTFWSYNLDWPDYLIIVMAAIFFLICYFQYVAEQKIKNT